MEPSPEAPELTRLLLRQREALARLLRRHGAGLFRYETLDDLIQGVHVKALQLADRFEYVNEPAFLSWLQRLVEQYTADRYRYWNARKREAGRLLRITGSELSSPSADGVHPAASDTTPMTLAARKEQFALAARAISLLLPRDQELIQAFADGNSVDEIAKHLRISPEAAKRARHRAVERFKKTYRLLAQE